MRVPCLDLPKLLKHVYSVEVQEFFFSSGWRSHPAHISRIKKKTFLRGKAVGTCEAYY